MRWGLIARSETDRGLGIQTYEMYRNLAPDKTLVIIVPGSGFRSRTEIYPGATTDKLRNEHGHYFLNEETVRDWWKGLDVVISVETMYDWRLIDWARADGVRTVIHGNPEFWMASNPQPDVWMWPTTWRLQHLPEGPVVPVPVPERPITAANPGGLLRAVHVVGNAAMGDRNGTSIVMNGMRQVPRDVVLDVYHQAPIAKSYHSRIRSLHAVPDRWDMYAGRHVLVLPRRYGGLCLPALEAMASGLAVMMSDCTPNTMWPIIPLQCDLSRTIQMQTGPVETYEVPSNILANNLKHLAMNPRTVEDHMVRSRQWAADNSWDSLRETYYAELDRSCS
jgi:hypothetical protein